MNPNFVRTFDDLKRVREEYILLVSLIAFLNTGKAKLLGKYCGNVFGNDLNISADYNLSNISANIFGENLVCNNEVFLLDNNSLIFSRNRSDC